MTGLTRAQRKVLSFLRAYCLEHGISPTYREIGAGVGIASHSIVGTHIKALEQRGYVTRLPGRERSALPVVLNGITLDLPPDLNGIVRQLAEKAGTTPEAVAIEAIRDGLRAVVGSRSLFASRETSSMVPA